MRNFRRTEGLLRAADRTLVSRMARPTSALIVDDEAHIRTYLRLILREMGVATCWEAGDGASGLELAVAHKPDVVLLDLSLPVMEGMEVLRQLSATQPETPVVIVTAKTAAGVVQETARFGAVGYVLKHYPKERLIQALEEVFAALDADDDENGE